MANTYISGMKNIDESMKSKYNQDKVEEQRNINLML
jgi:hypothetical protein